MKFSEMQCLLVVIEGGQGALKLGEVHPVVLAGSMLPAK
jgi:hypothetical protein